LGIQQADLGVVFEQGSIRTVAQDDTRRITVRLPTRLVVKLVQALDGAVQAAVGDRRLATAGVLADAAAWLPDAAPVPKRLAFFAATVKLSEERLPGKPEWYTLLR
jgi:hypothetical protein